MRHSRLFGVLLCVALVFTVVIAVPLPAVAGGSSWHWLNPTPRGETLNAVDIASADGNIAYAVGREGCTIKTYDGGKSWVEKSSPTSEDLYAVAFVNDKVGWAGGDNGVILKMTDGASWTKQTTGVSDGSICAIQFRSATLGWAADAAGRIFRTTDGGTTWNQLNAGFVPTSLYFVSDTVGFATTYDGRVFKSTDGGATWPTSQTLSGAPYLTDIAFDPDDPQVGWITHYGAGGAFKTVDGGASWVPVTVDTGSWNSVACAAGSNVVWMSGWNKQPDHLAKITDSATPSVQILADSAYGKDQTLFSVDCAGANKMLAVGMLGAAVRSNDGGATLLHRDQVIGRESLYDVQFVDLRTGYATASDGKVWKSTNAGKTWTATTTANTTTLLGVSFVDAKTGYAVGYSGVILKTTNGGVSWTKQTSPTTANFYAVKFVDANRGWVVGDGGMILWTTNGGTTWTQTLSATTSTLYSIDVLGNDAAAAGANGAICVTSNAQTNGGSWMTLTTTGTGTGKWSAVDYVGPNTFYVAGDSRLVPAIGTFSMLKTTTGGSAFSLVPADLTKLGVFTSHTAVTDIEFKDALVGWVAFGDGQVAKTTDGGANWTYEYAMDNKIEAISQVNGYVWAVGHNGRAASTYWYSPIKVYRFLHLQKGTHFYTIDVDEKHKLINTMSHIYKYEGVGYEYDDYYAPKTLHRFYNMKNGTHFYTADPDEFANVYNNMKATYSYDGPSYRVSDGSVPGRTVWRFYNTRVGSHFYTADPEEKANVEANLSQYFKLEGESFYLP